MPRHPFGRSSSLLVAVLLLLLLPPFVEAFGEFLLTGLFTAALVSALFSVRQPRWAVRVGTALVLAGLAFYWLRHLVGSPIVGLVGYVVISVAFALTAVVLVRNTLRARQVTFEEIAGALSAYLLLGVVWGLVYYLLESVAPGSLSITAGSDDTRLQASLYYSFVTLTTLGYGDIQPISDQARSLAIVEAAIGQIYVAVLLAKLVAMQASSSDGRTD